MDICASAGQLDRALQVASWMEEAGLPLNKIAYTTLIKACAEAGEGHRALEILDRVRASAVTLDYLGYLKVMHLRSRMTQVVCMCLISFYLAIYR